MRAAALGGALIALLLAGSFAVARTTSLGQASFRTGATAPGAPALDEQAGGCRSRWRRFRPRGCKVAGSAPLRPVRTTTPGRSAAGHGTTDGPLAEHWDGARW